MKSILSDVTGNANVLKLPSRDHLWFALMCLMPYMDDAIAMRKYFRAWEGQECEVSRFLKGSRFGLPYMTVHVALEATLGFDISTKGPTIYGALPTYQLRLTEPEQGERFFKLHAKLKELGYIGSNCLQDIHTQIRRYVTKGDEVSLNNVILSLIKISKGGSNES